MIKLLQVIEEGYNFMYGYCDYFAKALNEIFGYDYGLLYDYEKEGILHMFCIKGNKFIDYNGIQTKQQMIDKWKNIEGILKTGNVPTKIYFSDCKLITDQNEIKEITDSVLFVNYIKESAYKFAVNYIVHNIDKYKI